MKVGIVGAGFVGASCAKAMLLRGSCQDIILIDNKTFTTENTATSRTRTVRRDRGVATDLSHGALLCPPTRIRNGWYDDLSDADVVVVTAGINEREGKAIDRGDARGRLLLLPTNAAIYDDIIPQIARSAPRVPIVVVTDPPDPLADIARRHTATNPVVSAGTFLDSLRFRLQIGERLDCHPSSVDAIVIGEHGTSQVYVWSSAQVGGAAVTDLARNSGWDHEVFKTEVEQAVRYANIDIIEGTGASQHGIGIVTARIVEAILRDEGLVAPVGIYHASRFDVTLSLPSIIGANGVREVLMPDLTREETVALEASAAAIRDALSSL